MAERDNSAERERWASVCVRRERTGEAEEEADCRRRVQLTVKVSFSEISLFPRQPHPHTLHFEPRIRLPDAPMHRLVKLRVTRTPQVPQTSSSHQPMLLPQHQLLHHLERCRFGVPTLDPSSASSRSSSSPASRLKIQSEEMDGVRSREVSIGSDASVLIVEEGVVLELIWVEGREEI